MCVQEEQALDLEKLDLELQRSVIISKSQKGELAQERVEIELKNITLQEQLDRVRTNKNISDLQGYGLKEIAQVKTLDRKSILAQLSEEESKRLEEVRNNGKTNH